MRQINLLPESLQKRQYQKMAVNSAAALGSLTLVVLACIHLLLSTSVAKLENQVHHPAAYMDTMEFVQLREQIQGLGEEIKNYVGLYRPVLEAHLDNYSIVSILGLVGNMSNHRVWFTRFSLNTKTRDCEIEGKSFNTRLVSEFMLDMKKTPLFDNVTPISMEKGTDEKINFKIICKLK